MHNVPANVVGVSELLLIHTKLLTCSASRYSMVHTERSPPLCRCPLSTDRGSSGRNCTLRGGEGQAQRAYA